MNNNGRFQFGTGHAQIHWRGDTKTGAFVKGYMPEDFPPIPTEEGGEREIRPEGAGNEEKWEWLEACASAAGFPRDLPLRLEDAVKAIRDLRERAAEHEADSATFQRAFSDVEIAVSAKGIVAVLAALEELKAKASVLFVVSKEACTCPEDAIANCAPCMARIAIELSEKMNDPPHR